MRTSLGILFIGVGVLLIYVSLVPRLLAMGLPGVSLDSIYTSLLLRVGALAFIVAGAYIWKGAGRA